MAIPADPFARYRASELALDDDDPVATWEDEGSGGNDLTQATAGLRPTYKATDGPGGVASVLFEGHALQNDNYAGGETQPNTIIAVMEYVDNSSETYIYDGGSDGLRHALIHNPSLGDTWRGFAGNVVTMGGDPQTSVPYLLTLRFDGAASTLHVNETLTSGSVSIGNQELNGFTLGNRYSLEYGGDFYISEVLIYDRVLDAEELADLGEYVQVTYGIDLGYEVEDPPDPPDPPAPTSHTDLWEWLRHQEREGLL
jgi:hypothetical protein